VNAESFELRDGISDRQVAEVHSDDLDDVDDERVVE